MKSIVTPADARKYRDYEVEIRESRASYLIQDTSDGVVKWLCELRRIPSQKLFVVYVRKGVSTDERALVESLAQKLPQGAWAQFRDAWERRASKAGVIYFRQERGEFVNIDWVQLELEMMLDADVLAPTTGRGGE